MCHSTTHWHSTTSPVPMDGTSLQVADVKWFTTSVTSWLQRRPVAWYGPEYLADPYPVGHVPVAGSLYSGRHHRPHTCSCMTHTVPAGHAVGTYTTFAVTTRVPAPSTASATARSAGVYALALKIQGTSIRGRQGWRGLGRASLKNRSCCASSSGDLGLKDVLVLRMGVLLLPRTVMLGTYLCLP